MSYKTIQHLKTETTTIMCKGRESTCMAASFTKIGGLDP
jgi:hypothetical protein